MSSLRFTEYESKRNHVLEQLGIISSIAEELHLHTIHNRTNETIKQLEKDAFMLTVVGEFNRGKSMFINSLIGEKLLPSKGRPTTAILNKITYSTEQFIQLHFHNEKAPVSITAKELKNLNAPNEPDEDDPEEIEEYQRAVERIQEIDYAELGIPNAICQNGVEIYDTPGVNDLEETREDITYKFIPKSDAVILVLTAEAPLSKSEKGFLQQKILNADVSKVFIAVNFKDSLQTRESVERVQEFVRKNLEDLLHNPKVFMISGKEALRIRQAQAEMSEPLSQLEQELIETGIPALEEELGVFFQNERGNVKLLKPIKRGMKLSKDLIEGSLSMKIQALSMEREHVLQKIEELLPQVDSFLQRGSSIKNTLRANLISELDAMKATIQKNMDRMSAEVEDSLTYYYGDITKENMKAHISSISNPIQKEMQQKLMEKQKSVLSGYTVRAYSELEGETKKLDNQVKESFNLSLELDGLHVTAFDDDFMILGGIALGSLGLGALAAVIALPILAIPLIPAAIASFFGFGASVREQYKERERQKQLDSVKSSFYQAMRKNKKKAIASFEKEWESTVQTIIDEFDGEVITKANQLKEELNGLIQSKRLEQQEIEAKRTYYNRQKEQLQNIFQQFSQWNQELEKQLIQK